MPNRNKKPGLTLDEHRALAAELNQLHDYITDLGETLNERYGYRQPTALLWDMEALTGLLRRALVRLVAEETAGRLADVESHAIYFPHSSRSNKSLFAPSLWRWLTRDEHRKLGLGLARRQNRVAEFGELVSDRYQDLNLDQLFYRIAEASADLRSWLNHRLGDEHAGWFKDRVVTQNGWTRAERDTVYYPWLSGEDQVGEAESAA